MMTDPRNLISDEQINRLTDVGLRDLLLHVQRHHYDRLEQRFVAEVKGIVAKEFPDREVLGLRFKAEEYDCGYLFDIYAAVICYDDGPGEELDISETPASRLLSDLNWQYAVGSQSTLYVNFEDNTVTHCE